MKCIDRVTPRQGAGFLFSSAIYSEFYRENELRSTKIFQHWEERFAFFSVYNSRGHLCYLCGIIKISKKVVFVQNNISKNLYESITFYSIYFISSRGFELASCRGRRLGCGRVDFRYGYGSVARYLCSGRSFRDLGGRNA